MAKSHYLQVKYTVNKTLEIIGVCFTDFLLQNFTNLPFINPTPKLYSPITNISLWVG